MWKILYCTWAELTNFWILLDSSGQVGPQRSLYIPGPLLQRGRNEACTVQFASSRSTPKFSRFPTENAQKWQEILKLSCTVHGTACGEILKIIVPFSSRVYALLISSNFLAICSPISPIDDLQQGLSQVLIFDIDSPACGENRAPPAPRIVLVAETKWLHAACSRF